MAHILSSVFKEHIENFIALKRQCGYGYIAEEKILYCFDKLANEKGIQQPIISKELAQELSRTRPNEAKATTTAPATTARIIVPAMTARIMADTVPVQTTVITTTALLHRRQATDTRDTVLITRDTTARHLRAHIVRHIVR